MEIYMSTLYILDNPEFAKDNLSRVLLQVYLQTTLSCPKSAIESNTENNIEL